MPESANGINFPLTNVKLHSPSAIMGTPLDPTSRFEYPFPSPGIEYDPTHSALRFPHAPHPSHFLAVNSSVARQRQSYIHPQHELREVPVPPTLDRRVNIELRFPRPSEGANVLGQAHTSIKRRKDDDETSKKT